MNILVLNYEYPPIGGGGAPVSRDIAEGYVKCGDKVSVLTMCYQDLPEESVENGVKVYRLNCRRKRKDACSPLEQFSYLCAVLSFIKSHQEFQTYDVCHAHFVIPTGWAAMKLKNKYNIPYIVTAHGSDVEGHNRKISIRIMHFFLRNCWRKIVNHACFVTAPSEYLKVLMENNYESGNYRLVPNGLNYESYRSLNLPTLKEKRILIVGRIQKFKNIQFIIRALSNINKATGLNGWTIDIVGDGPYLEEIENLSATEGLSGFIRFYGWLEHKSLELKNIYKSASIYISASEFESFGLSVVEAVASGCFPLVSDIPAHRALLEEKYRFSLENDMELIEKLKKRMDNGAKSNNIDLSRYDIEGVVQEYRKLLERSRYKKD